MYFQHKNSAFLSKCIYIKSSNESFNTLCENDNHTFEAFGALSLLGFTLSSIQSSCRPRCLIADSINKSRFCFPDLVWYGSTKFCPATGCTSYYLVWFWFLSGPQFFPTSCNLDFPIWFGLALYVAMGGPLLSFVALLQSSANYAYGKGVLLEKAARSWLLIQEIHLSDVLSLCLCFSFLFSTSCYGPTGCFPSIAIVLSDH